MARMLVRQEVDLNSDLVLYMSY